MNRKSLAFLAFLSLATAGCVIERPRYPARTQGAQSAEQELEKLLSPIPLARVQAMKVRMDNLKPGMTLDESLDTLHFDTSRTYAGDTSKSETKMHIQFVLHEEHSLVLLFDTSSGTPRLLSAMIDEKTWPPGGHFGDAKNPGQPPQSAPASPWHRESGRISYQKIGLEIEVPNWDADISEHENLWTLLGVPLVDNPVAGTQFCVTVQIDKMDEKVFRLCHPEVENPGTDLQTWINLSHRETSLQSNSYWIYIRRDIFSNDGYVYKVYAKIKRVGDKWEFNVKDRVGDYHKIADEAQSMIDRITLLPSKKETPPRPVVAPK